GVPTEKVTLDLLKGIIFKGVTLQGIYGRRMFQTWIQMTELLRMGRLNLDPLFSAEMALEEFSTAFELLQAGEADKIIVYPNGRPR
ncbi:MAG: L-threonine 3-dehydrogenase, partial [Firmicutes bacterium]|nr:L-threonine 3-dehydrogenase [Bacillota bacterium]